MARIIFDYGLTKAAETELSKNGYEVQLWFRPGDGDEYEEQKHSVKKIPKAGSFPKILNPIQIRTLLVRLKIVRRNAPDSGCFTTYRRLNFPPTTTTERVHLRNYKIADHAWNVSGTVVPDPGFDVPFDRLKVKLQVKSGRYSEEPAWLDINNKGEFSFVGRRMVLDPGKAYEVLLTVCDDTGLELGRHYKDYQPGEKPVATIRVGSPFLDVWAGFRATHPQLVARLERFDYDPKQAHRFDDKWLIFRRYKELRNYQVAEGVTWQAKHGPAGDPDWTWNIVLDPLYDSEEGFRLPNEKNRLKHGGLHVEACLSLSRGKIPDGLAADAKTVPEGRRVWMLGTHVFDDAIDFSPKRHEHYELHPLYVMEECMGGWFHFAVFESIAIAEEVRKAGTPPSSRWPRTETKPEPYRKAYLDLNPHQCRDELAQTYNLIMERFEREKDKQGLVEFFAQTSVRYAKLGVDLGHSLEFSPDRYRELALEMIEDDEMGAVGYVLEEYLDRLFRFLHGPASYAHTPIKGPAPNSFLRCVFALENVWASEVSGNQIGEPNPRVSLNRVTAQPIDVPRRKLGDLYNKLFALVNDSARRGELFADAVLRYRHWAVPTPNRETEGMDTAALRSFGSNQDPQALAQKMEARVNAFWEALTPHLQT